MFWIYVDNFRGFQNTCIPIKDVNFLVGENSTGKTSILNLIYLLTTPEFWFRQSFNTDEINFGSYDDIVSMESEDKKNFRIGFIDRVISERNDKEESNVFLFTFVKENGFPLINEYDYIKNSKEYRILFSNKEIEYEINKIPEISKDISLIKYFERWKIPPEKSNLQKIKSNKIFFSRKSSLSFITNIIANENNENIDEINFAFEQPSFADNNAWIGPIRSKPQRTYDEYITNFSSEGRHVPYLLRDEFEKKSKRSRMLFNSLEEIGKESGLFDSIVIKKFGKDIDSPFAVDVKINNKELKIINTGYGISQSLPVLVELIRRSDGWWYEIQQPEVHLHPKAQAALGDLFYDLSISNKKKFLIETHSDYIIDRFRINIMEKKMEGSIESQVLFFTKGEKGNLVTPISINENGDYSNAQPNEFREFFINEQRRLLGI